MAGIVPGVNIEVKNKIVIFIVFFIFLFEKQNELSILTEINNTDVLPFS